MNIINPTDVIFATVSQRGTTLSTLRLSGVTSPSELMSRILRALAGITGLATITIRNSSQGWLQRRAMMLTPA